MSTKWMAKVNNWLQFIQYLLFPGICIVCDRPSERQLDLCLPCERQLPRVTSPCLSCGLPLHTGSYPARYCGTCLSKPPPFLLMVSALAYREPASRLISAFKYQARLSNGRVLSRLLVEHVKDFYAFRPLPDLLIPMPLHQKRLRQRGFNQALEIARIVSHELQIPLSRHDFIRLRDTARQQGLKRQQRQQNLRRAFDCSNKAMQLPERVAIIDDVVTSTASVRALCQALKRQGSREIHVWSLARVCQWN